MQDITSTIGNNLREIRKQKALTLDNVADLTGVSKSMLGEIERNATNPTITVLWKIANGLRIPFSFLLKQARKEVTVVHREDTKLVIESGGCKVSIVFDYDEQKKCEIYIKEFAPSGKLESEPHGIGVSEHILISQGQLAVKIEDQLYHLHEGEAISFKSCLPHAFYNQGNGIAIAYTVIYYEN